MPDSRCSFCGQDRYVRRRVEYLYTHQGKHLLVPNTPVEVCCNCGMKYYDAAVLEEIERRFFAIENKTEQPDRYVQVPEKGYPI